MDLCLVLALAGLAVHGGSGVPALFLGKTSNTGQKVAALLSVLGSLLGLAGIASFLTGGAPASFTAPWSVPGGSFSIAIDGLTAIFLAPIFLVSGLGAIYGLAYWPQSAHPENGRKLRFFYGLLAAGMALLAISRNSVLFLSGWEIMALSAYFLVATEDRQAPVREAAWVYLVAAHLGMLALFGLFALLHGISGSFDWATIPAGALGAWQAAAVFLLALLGFGLKAGIMPLHFWLPDAHANAPSHVSALLSGVMIKMGIYGLVRILSLVPDPPAWWGFTLMGLGLASGFLGIAAAIGQSDLKRLLAYSSIENIGIITMGIGLSLAGRALGYEAWTTLGLAAALLHVINHSLFKPALFFAAGSLLHAAHTRRLDQLGGLGRAMPLTAFSFLAGAAAICGLPGLNGFVSEFLLFLGLFQAARAPLPAHGLLATAAAAGLALISALAAACFIRAAGAIFLGNPRTPAAERAQESGLPMTGVLIAISAACLGIGLAPWALAPLLDGCLRSFSWSPTGPAAGIEALAPFRPIGWLACGMAVLAGLGFLLLRALAPPRPPAGKPAPGTWDCGYADPSSPRLQYTAASTGEMLVGLFRWAVRVDVQKPVIREAFPASARFQSEPRERLLAGILAPFFRKWAERFFRLRILQRGQMQIYLLYILAALIALLAWAAFSPWSAR